MFKYTYIIEYNIICNDNREIKIIRYSSDYELTSFVVNRETIANTTRSRAQFFYILFNGKILYNQFLYECFNSNFNFQLKVTFLLIWKNTYISLVEALSCCMVLKMKKNLDMTFYGKRIWIILKK